MNDVQKMALVPHELLSTMDASREKNIRRSPAMSRLLDVDAEMKRTLNDTEGFAEDEKASHYAQLLRRYKTFNEKSSRQLPISVQVVPNADTLQQDTSASPSATSVEREIIESVPKLMSHKAALLLQRLKNNPEIEWDESGQIIYKDVKIKHTNVVDLINDVLRQRKTVPSPPGWQIFAQALARDNVPYELVGNVKRRKYMFDQARKLASTPRSTVIKGKQRKRKATVDHSTPMTFKTPATLPTWDSYSN
jgi:hypothetical protein